MKYAKEYQNISTLQEYDELYHIVLLPPQIPSFHIPFEQK